MGRSKAAKARDEAKGNSVSDPRLAAMSQGAYHDAAQRMVVEATQRADAIHGAGRRQRGSLHTMMSQAGYGDDHIRNVLTKTGASKASLNDKQFGYPHSVDVDFSEQHYMEKGPIKTHRVTVLAHTSQDALHQAHDMVKTKGHYVHGTRHVETDRI